MGFIFDPNLVLYLPLYELDGASFMSRDAYGHLCAVTGDLWRPNGRFFDGTDDKIVIPDHESLRGTAGITIAVAIREDGFGNHQHIVSKHNATVKKGWTLFLHSGGAFYFQIGDGVTWPVASAISATYSATDWYYVIAWNDGTTIGVSVNGVESTGTGGTIASHTPDVWVGRSVQDNNFTFNGVISEALMFRRAFNAVERQRFYLGAKQRMPWLR